jgi:hypothetical protein
MRKLFFLSLCTLILASCALIDPYTITFTNEPGEIVDPATTLDFVVSQPVLAYISRISCTGADPIEILPVVTPDMEISTVHKLPLTALNQVGTITGLEDIPCEITVTAFDRSTSYTSSSNFTVMISPDMPETADSEPDDGVPAETTGDSSDEDTSDSPLLCENDDCTETGEAATDGSSEVPNASDIINPDIDLNINPVDIPLDVLPTQG